ncbi:chorismate mutase [Streptomyces chrestomyceticus]|uniref:Chorismate mutase n=1 Tax=Streptomyces chrestomyceticus TaxID=68185 RepID=A0ABU7WM74_9ACTN
MSGTQAIRAIQAVTDPVARPEARTTGTSTGTGTGTSTATRRAAVKPDTGARTEAAAGVITDARARIDDLDGRIIGLVQERMAVSAVIQRERIGSGGRRVNLSREMEVLEHYRGQLGRPGTALAMTLLELCRGRI